MAIQHMELNYCCVLSTSIKWLQKQFFLQDMQDNKCDNGDHELPNYVGQCARTSIKFVRGRIMSSSLYFSDKTGHLNIIFQPNFGSGSHYH